MARDPRQTALKLRALASSPNAHEAALAREMFQAFTTRHHLSRKDLLPRSHAERMAFYQEQQRAAEVAIAGMADSLAQHGVRLVVRHGAYRLVRCKRRRKEDRP